jgi:transposase
MKGDHWMDIRADFKKGLNYTEIGKKYGIDPRTVKKYSQAEKKPEYPKGTKRESEIEKYKGMIDELLCEAPYSAVRILEIITEQGFDGKYTIVKDYVKSKKEDLNKQATVRFETIPGLQGQVDWAHFPDHRVFEDGKSRSCIAF